MTLSHRRLLFFVAAFGFLVGAAVWAAATAVSG